MEKHETGDIKDILDNLDEKIDIIFRHQMLFSLYRAIPRDYGMGYMSEVDVHTLGYIETNPGILAKRIAEMTYRSKGTVSLSLAKMEEKGLIEQRVNPDKKSERNLYLTEKGKEVCRVHREYDRRTTINYLLKLLQNCTPEEINGFFKVSRMRSDLFEDVIREERGKYELYKRNIMRNEISTKDSEV